MSLPRRNRSAPAESNTKELFKAIIHTIFKPLFSGFANITSVELTIPGVVILGCVVMFLVSLISSVSWSPFVCHTRISSSPTQWKLTQVSRYAFTDTGGFVTSE